MKSLLLLSIALVNLTLAIDWTKHRTELGYFGNRFWGVEDDSTDRFAHCNEVYVGDWYDVLRVCRGDPGQQYYRFGCRDKSSGEVRILDTPCENDLHTCTNIDTGDTYYAQCS